MSVYNPVIPYCGPIQVGLSPGSLIRVQGVPHSTARCFAINLQCGPSVNPRDDIALHLSPVFSPPPRVVRNSLQSQRWGPEESFGGFPFFGGQGFEIMILIESDHFKIAINGQHFTEFHHRIALQRINYLAIDGEVAVNLITFEPSKQLSYGMPSAPVMAPQMTSYGSGAPYPTNAVQYSSMSGQYAPQAPAYPSQGYPSQAPGYPSQAPGYPSQAPGYPPQSSYPQTGYPSTAYPHSPQSQSKGILGGALGGTLGGLATGAAATAIGSKLFGSKHHGMGGHHGMGIPGMGSIPGMGGHSKHSNPIGIPIAGLAAGAGAAALGAAVLTGHHPFKKAKKMFKHKGFKHKGFKHKGWKHKGWSSGSSS